MSFSSLSSLNYDDCTYNHNLRQSVGVGDYMINQPRVECVACFQTDPTIALNGNGIDVCSDKPLVDVDSELKLISRKASNCPAKKFVPSEQAFCNTARLPDCRGLTNEDTRLSNPPCTLRSSGWNRWEWLCQNPQEKALVPFDFNISNRIIVKDNHRPCVPKPIDQGHTLPGLNASDDMVKHNQQCVEYSENLPSTMWRKKGEYQYYS